MVTTQKTDIVTIDGPSGVGKSTVAKAVALRLGFRYLDTGAMYRAVTLAALRASLGLDPPDENQIRDLLKHLRLSLDGEGRVLLDGERQDDLLREDRVTVAVSAVSSMKPVRSYLLKLQREFGRAGGIVAEGRDLGSVVFPEAAFKFYLDADPTERARRRTLQNRDATAGSSPSEDEVLLDQKRRDLMDSERSLSPLAVSKDMVVLDTTHMDQDEVIERILACIRSSGP